MKTAAVAAAVVVVFSAYLLFEKVNGNSSGNGVEEKVYRFYHFVQTHLQIKFLDCMGIRESIFEKLSFVNHS